MPESRESAQGLRLTVREFVGLQKRVSSADHREGLFFVVGLMTGPLGGVIWLKGGEILWGMILLMICAAAIGGLLVQFQRRRREGVSRRFCCPACGKNLQQPLYVFTLVASRHCGYCGERVLAENNDAD